MFFSRRPGYLGFGQETFALKQVDIFRSVLLERKDHHRLEANAIAAADVLDEPATCREFGPRVGDSPVIYVVEKPVPDKAGVMCFEYIHIAVARVRLVRRPREVDMDAGNAILE